MNQRTLAALIAGPLVVVLGAVALAVPLPYASYSPGPTFDILGEDSDQAEIIQVEGHRSYYDDGQIRFTTVLSSARGRKLSLGEALARWANPDQAVIPYDVVHPPDQTAEQEKVEGEVQMTTSQDVAKAVALGELGQEVEPRLQVAHVDKEGPAHGELQVRDVFVKVDGKPVTSSDQVVEQVRSHDDGSPVTLQMRRDGKDTTVRIVPEVVDGTARIGVTLGVGYEFPFEIDLQVDPAVGGPSAGLMFSLAIYDTLTPGSLTGGRTIAGTGEISPDGKVGAIGGIAQKIAGAEDAGADLFFVPAGNCSDVTGLDPDLRLVKATTMHRARLSLETWVEDPDADLPTC
ncbi:PDZ domain-containing protein [Nocardioides sp. GY 10113]|uniref:YlbL family protein n=1 Tax=Nocardioides sp. GY 10113 TaxID=2569761 RepID=UPI0010A8A459|nr:PDZ domain-containing protein [Nocardioides sp. GY 10113]TIC81288.1 PDZ domain-containing protein [Nocardioides sp. GY 10113]